MSSHFENDPLLLPSRYSESSSGSSLNDRKSTSQRSGADFTLTEHSSELNRLLGELSASEGSNETPSSRWEKIGAILKSGSTNFHDFLNLITLSGRSKALGHEGVGQAAFLIRDAFLGEVENPAEGAYDPYIDPKKTFRNAMAVICGRICSSRPVIRILHATAWIILLLTFVEPPYWCSCNRNSSMVGHRIGCDVLLFDKGIPAMIGNTFNFDHRQEVDLGNSSAEEVEYYPNTHSMLLTLYQSSLIETIGLAIISIIILIRLGRDGMNIAIYLRRGPSQGNHIVQILCIAGIGTSLYMNYRVLLPYLRLILLTSFLRGVKQDLKVLVRTLSEAFNALALLAVFMAFYAWFGCVMFIGTPEGRMHFPSFTEALWTLWICVTTANYPDVMMTAFNNNRWVAVYFISFMLVSFFFFMNVVLAGVVNVYNTAMKQRYEERLLLSYKNLKEAFMLMDPNGNGVIDRETIMALFLILNEDFPEFRTLSDDDTKLLFAILDKDGTNTISEAEFLDFGSVILLEFTKSSDYTTFTEKYFPQIFASSRYQQFCEIVKSVYFENAIDMIVVLNAVVIGIQSYPELSGSDVNVDPKYWDGSIDTVWEVVEAVFTGIYALEVVVKLTVFSWKRYIETTKNIFDFTITLLAIASSVIVYYPNAISDSRIIRMIVMLRVLRLIRLLTAMKRFQLIISVSAEILPAARDVCLLLFLLMFLFSSIGMSLFGGLISRDPMSKLSYLILGTEFAESEYWGNNFNDMLSAMNVLFNLLVVNNWTVLEAGFEAVAQTKWVRLYFVLFYIFGVILVNNLVIAFIINEFLVQREIFREKTDAEMVGEGEAVIYERRAIFDASQITGTETGTQGNYIARLRYATEEGHDHERLRKLFTQTSSADSQRTSVRKLSRTGFESGS